MPGRISSEAAEALSAELRTAQDPVTRRRRRSAACSLGAGGVLGVLSLYQLGLIGHLPDLPAWWSDADRVSGSGEAYWLGTMADTPLGMASFLATATLAGTGLGGTRRRRLVARAWTAKAAVDALYGVVLAVEQPLRYRRLCPYCLTVTALSVAALVQSLPEGREAWRSVSPPAAS